jgi:hypothetical protein
MRIIITVRPCGVSAVIEHDKDGLFADEYFFMNIGHCLAHFGALLPLINHPIHIRSTVTE